MNLKCTCYSGALLTSGDMLPAEVIPVGAFSERSLFSPRLTVQFHSPERNLSEMLAGIREQAWGWSTFLISHFLFIPGTQHFRKSFIHFDESRFCARHVPSTKDTDTNKLQLLEFRLVAVIAGQMRSRVHKHALIRFPNLKICIWYCVGRELDHLQGDSLSSKGHTAYAMR